MFGLGNLFGKKKDDTPSLAPIGNGTVTEADVLAALRTIVEPELGRDLVSLKMIQGIRINGGDVAFTVVMPTPAGGLKAQIEKDCQTAVYRVKGVTSVKVNVTSNIVADSRIRPQINAPIKNTIAVASGKGGVGKSTVAVNLALSLSLDGAKVGLLDADIYGPNVPMMLGATHLPAPINNRIPPAEAYGLKLVSMGFLLKPDQPVIWRGPMLGQALRQFLTDVEWGELDYLVIDMPPGTGDVQLSLAQLVPLTGGVIVTTPQKVALSDVRKGVGTFAQLDVPILGVIENMSYFIAPDTGKRYEIFGTGGGLAYADEIGVPFLGALPIDPRIAQGGDTGKPIVATDPKNPASLAMRQVAHKAASGIALLNLNRVPEGVIGLGDIPVLLG